MNKIDQILEEIINRYTLDPVHPGKLTMMGVQSELRSILKAEMEKIIPKANKALLSPQAYYSDTDPGVAYELGRNDQANLIRQALEKLFEE